MHRNKYGIIKKDGLLGVVLTSTYANAFLGTKQCLFQVKSQLKGKKIEVFKQM